MICSKFHRRFAGILALSVAAAVACADMKVVSQVQFSMNGDYHPTEYTTTYYKGDWVRVDGSNHTILSNTKTHKLITIDHATKTYTISDGDLSSDAADMMKEMGAKVSAKVNPTSDHKQIVGYDATRYLADLDFDMKVPQQKGALMHLKMHMDNWATADLSNLAPSASFMGTPSDLIRSFVNLAGIDQVKDELAKIKGLSLSNDITTTIDGPNAPAPIAFEVVYQVISVSQTKLDPAMFRVPKDYKQGDPDSDDDNSIQWRPAGSGG